MATVDLWPAEITSDSSLEGPTVLLKEQAALLGQKTKNLVEAEVVTSTLNTSTNDRNEFADVFRLTCSPLNYQHVLFHIKYPLEFFPATVYWAGYKNGYIAESREDLEIALSEIFSDERTIRIIQALIARSRG